MTSRAVAAALGVALAAATACESRGSDIAGIGGPADPRPSYPGFDIAVYPGDALMSAWQRPASPYYWVGYYLAAPCHRDVTWMGKFARVASLGWGTLVIYVGQQDWAHIPNLSAATRSLVVDWPGTDTRSGRLPSSDAPLVSATTASAVTCSAVLLTAAQAVLEAADAVAKTASEGFPTGSTIYLDVEYVTSVSAPLKEYVATWIAEVLRDGRYVPAIYAAKSNAPEIHAIAVAAFTSAGRADAPKFWIASSSGFSLENHPTDVGLSYAAAWQGRYEIGERWGGVSATIDVNVAAARSPSAPLSSLSTRVAW